MPNHPTPWFPTAPERQHTKALVALDRRTEPADEEVAGIAKVEGRAHYEKMKASLLRREAMRLDPDGADEYRMISLASTMGMINLIDNYSRRW